MHGFLKIKSMFKLVYILLGVQTVENSVLDVQMTRWTHRRLSPCQEDITRNRGNPETKLKIFVIVLRLLTNDFLYLCVILSMFQGTTVHIVTNCASLNPFTPYAHVESDK